MLPRRVLQLFVFAAPLMLSTVSAETSLQPPPIIPYGLRSPSRTPNSRPRPL